MAPAMATTRNRCRSGSRWRRGGERRPKRLLVPAGRFAGRDDVAERALGRLEVHVQGPRLGQEDGESAPDAEGWRAHEVGGSPFAALENIAHPPEREREIAIRDPPAASSGDVQPHAEVDVAESHSVERLQPGAPDVRVRPAHIRGDNAVDAVADPQVHERRPVAGAAFEGNIRGSRTQTDHPTPQVRLRADVGHRHQAEQDREQDAAASRASRHHVCSPIGERSRPDPD